VNASDLIDPAAVHKFIALVHERAAAAIAGMGDLRRPVLHLCSAAADDTRFFHSAYNIGDIEHMAANALIDSEAGKNVFIEPRLVRPGRPVERGGLNATLAVFASVADSDSDTGKPFAATIPPSVVVETSPPANQHSWYFLTRAIGADDAQQLGKLMRNAGGDHCSGNPVQPFRCCGTPNFPNRKKIERGRTVVPTRLLSITDRTYTADELRVHFSVAVPAPPTKQTPEPVMAVHSRAYSRGMAKAVLAAEPGADRSAQFMSAANHAVRGGLTADEFEALARQHLPGCAGKYADRLRQEIDRCYAKIMPGYATAYASEAQRRFMWHRYVIADPELGAGALRFAYLIAHEGGNDRHVSISLQKAASELSVTKSTAQRGRDQLVARKWLICIAPSCYALGRGGRTPRRTLSAKA
jgi:hypothetical protein